MSRGDKTGYRIPKKNVIEYLKNHKKEDYGINDINYDNIFFIDKIKNMFEDDKIYTGLLIDSIVIKYITSIKQSIVSKYSTKRIRVFLKYWIGLGWSLSDAKEKVIKAYNYQQVFFTRKELKEYIYQNNPYNMNLTNNDFIDNFIDNYCDISNPMSIRQIDISFYKLRDEIYGDNKKHRGFLKANPKYYYCRGYSEEETKKIITKVQSKCSLRCKEYYISKGMKEEDAITQVSKIQSSYSYKSKATKLFWITLGYSEEDAIIKANEYASKRSVWAFQYWKDKGLTDEDAWNEVYKHNASSPLCISYKGDIKKYILHINNFIEKKKKTIRKHIQTNDEYVYKMKLFSINRISKIENVCFEYLIKNIDSNIKHEPYIVVFPDTYISSVGNANFYACDGFLEYNNHIIIIEYDSGIFHNEIDDLKRDEDIFYIDENVIGILRITEKFFTNKYDTSKNDKIIDALNKLKSCEEERILL